jgi:excisionase family DNA binding protein
MPARDELMTTKDLAEYVRRPLATIYQWNSRGIGPRYIRRGRTVLYRRSDVDKWLSDGYVTASTSETSQPRRPAARR